MPLAPEPMVLPRPIGRFDFFIRSIDTIPGRSTSVSLIENHDLRQGGIAGRMAILDSIRGARSSPARSGGSF